MTNTASGKNEWVHIPELCLRLMTKLARRANDDGFWAPPIGKDIDSIVTGYLMAAASQTAAGDGTVSKSENDLLSRLEKGPMPVRSDRPENNDRLELPAFVRAVIDRDSSRGERESIKILMALYATCIAVTVADGKTTTGETGPLFDLYLKPMAEAIADARIASHSEMSEMLYGPRHVSEFCDELERSIYLSADS
jgi:hypothetical protein